MLTGEPVPVGQATGDTLTIAGTVNWHPERWSSKWAAPPTKKHGRSAPIPFWPASSAMVEDAQATRLPVQSLINRVTAVFLPWLLVVALLAAGGWLIWGPDPAKALVIGGWS